MLPEIRWVEGVELRNVRIFENPTNWTWHSPARPHFNLWIALEGEGVMFRADREIPIRAGSAFLFSPREVVRGWSTGESRMVNFTTHFVCSEAAQTVPENFLAPEPPACIHPVAWVAQLCRYMSGAFYLDREANRGVLLQALGLLLLAMEQGRGQRAFDPSERNLLRIVERIRRNPAADYSVEELAAQSGLSVSQFARRFKGFTGRAPRQFMIEERVSQAEAYLDETNLSIEAIAERLGYRDVYFFSRQFRRFRGMPPSEWRRRTRVTRKTAH
jgi:AraC-like DNA-binding protein